MITWNQQEVFIDRQHYMWIGIRNRTHKVALRIIWGAYFIHVLHEDTMLFLPRDIDPLEFAFRVRQLSELDLSVAFLSKLFV